MIFVDISRIQTVMVEAVLVEVKTAFGFGVEAPPVIKVQPTAIDAPKGCVGR